MVGSPWLLVALIVLGVAVLTWVHRRNVAAVERDRRLLFDRACHVLDEHELVDRGMDFPILYGSFAGWPVRVEPIVDTLSLRLAPVLRLVVTARRNLPGQTAVSVLQDETGQEFYAGHRDLVRLRDGDWPITISVASETNDVDRLLVDQLTAAVSADSGIKQVLVTEHGVRCVVRGAQGDLTTYRTTRRADLAGARVTPDVLLDALRTMVAVGDRVARTATLRAESR